METIRLHIGDVHQKIVANIIVRIGVHQLRYIIRHNLIAESVVIERLPLPAIGNIVEGVRVCVRNVRRQPAAGDVDAPMLARFRNEPVLSAPLMIIMLEMPGRQSELKLP